MTSDTSKTLMERARGSSRIGAFAEAEQYLKKYLASSPSDRDAELFLGTILVRGGKISEAIQIFIRILSRNPRDAEALNNLAVAYRTQNRLEAAQSVIQKAILIDPSRAEFHYNLGNVQKQAGNLKEAAKCYAKVVDLDNGFIPAYNNLGTMRLRLGETAKASSVFRKGLALDPNNATLLFNCGLAQESQGDFAEAAKQYALALKRRPGWLEAMNNLGITLLKAGRAVDAAGVFKRMLAIDPNNAEAHNNLAILLEEQGRHNDALLSYKRALEAKPSYIKARVNLARLMEAKGDTAGAVEELEKLPANESAHSEIQRQLAELYFRLDRYKDALAKAEQAVKLDPNNPQAWLVLGLARQAMKQDNAARSAFTRLLALDPDAVDFHLDLADLYFREHRYEETETELKAYLEKRPGDRNAFMLLGRLYTESGDIQKALETFQELLLSNPNDVEALSAITEIKHNAGDAEGAMEAAGQLVNIQGQRASSDDLSDLNRSLESYEKAIKNYGKAMSEMWERNLAKLRPNGDNEKEDIAALFDGVFEAPAAIDENEETLLIEDYIHEESPSLSDLLNSEADPESVSAQPPPDPYSGLAETGNQEPVPSQGKEPYEPPQAPPPMAAPISTTPMMVPINTPAPIQSPIQATPIYSDSSFSKPAFSAAFQEPPQVKPINHQLYKPVTEETPRSPSYIDQTQSPCPEAQTDQLMDTNTQGGFEFEKKSETSDSVDFLDEGLSGMEPFPEDIQAKEIEPCDDDKISETGNKDLDRAANDTMNPVEGKGTGSEPGSTPKSGCVEDSDISPTGTRTVNPARIRPVYSELIRKWSRGKATASPLPPDAKKTLEMFSYLRSLIQELPEKRKAEFMSSDERLAMEYVIDRLEGKPGLFAGIVEKQTEIGTLESGTRASETFASGTGSPGAPEVALTATSLIDTLSYLDNLMGALPDKNLKSSIDRRVERIVAGIKQARPDRRSDQ